MRPLRARAREGARERACVQSSFLSAPSGNELAPSVVALALAVGREVNVGLEIDVT